MNNSFDDWFRRSVFTVSLALTPLGHDCEIKKFINSADSHAEIPVKEDLICNHKTFIFGAGTSTPAGLTNTWSGDFIDCTLDGVING